MTSPAENSNPNLSNVFQSEVNTLTAGPRYIRDCCLTLERRYGFRADAWGGKALFQKDSGWKTLHDRNTNSAQKRQSHCVVYENREVYENV